MDGGGGKRRHVAALAALAGVIAALPATAAGQSPASGTPKILLAFDASGSMATDDGAGTPKIQAAQDAAVDLLGSLPPSTQVGLRVFGGTKPSRPIGPACRDSSLVLPIGPLDRAQAEQQIRSFKAKGRTPIAYALERAAEDLGGSGPRTIILVSDGKDTCRPPSPCQVARRVARGGVEMRIQAIGFNVDRAARRELQCIAQAGGGVYTDADNAATLKEQLRVLSTRALRQYVPKGRAVRGGPNARQATGVGPGRYVDAILPDSERWYAVELRRGETLEASASFIPPKREVADHGYPTARLDIVTPTFEIPDRQNSSSHANPFERRGFVDGFGVVSRPIGVGGQAASDQPFSQPGRYYLKLRLNDTDGKDLFNATGGQPYAVELAVAVLGRRGGNPAPSKGPQPKAPAPTSGPTPAGVASPNEPPATALLVLVGGGLAAVGFAGGVALRRRRAS